MTVNREIDESIYRRFSPSPVHRFFLSPIHRFPLFIPERYIPRLKPRALPLPPRPQPQPSMYIEDIAGQGLVAIEFCHQ